MIGHIGDRVDFWTRAKLWRSGKINDIMVNKLAGVTQYLVTDDNGYNHYVSEWNVRLPGSMNPPFGAYSAESMFERDAEKDKPLYR